MMAKAKPTHMRPILEEAIATGQLFNRDQRKATKWALATIDDLTARLAAAEAAMENARDVARLIFEKATFIGTAKEHNRFPGWQKIAEMYTWLAQQEDDTAAKGWRE